MVSILPPKRGPANAIADALSQFGRNLPNVMEERFQHQRKMGAIDQIGKEIANMKQTAAETGKPIDPMQLLLQFAKTGAVAPGLERALAPMMDLALKSLNANASQNIRQPGEEGGISGAENGEQPQFNQIQVQPKSLGAPEQVSQRPRFPGFIGQEEQQTSNYPSNIPPSGMPGNAPQEATTGVISPLLDRSGKVKEAKRIIADDKEMGIITSFPEAMARVNESEEDKKEHNKEVENERKNRVASQKTYGKKAVDYLLGVMEKATPEQQAIFAKMGENVSLEGKSEAEKDLFLAKEATKFKNAIDNVKSDLTAPRSYNKLHRQFMGSDKDFKQASSDLKTKLKPILDLGLYDTARTLLTDLGYYPEERESVINPMSERSNILMNQVPEAKRQRKELPSMFTPGLQPTYTYEPGQVENVKDGLRELKKSDPNFSLVLARKAFEDKGYDWRVYRDALNDLIKNEGFKLEDDQFNQQTYLDSAPLNALEKILQSVNLIGR